MANYLPVINTNFTLFGGHAETVPVGWSWKTEEHPAFELIYVLAGEQRTISDTNEFFICAGQMILIPIGIRHTNYQVGSEKLKYFTMHFNLESPELKYLLISGYANRIITTETAGHAALVAQLDTIVAMIQADYQLFDYLNLQASVLDVILTLTKALQNDKALKVSQGEINQFMLWQTLASDIKDKLDYQIYHANHATKIAIAEVVEAHHISQSYALKLFKKFTAKSPQAYLIDLKLATAKQLLLQPNMLISEVAEKLAYSSPSHFTREFTKNIGMSPRQYIVAGSVDEN
ncbi:AraC family transcriptional regulator [Periweissella cryptocerci]|uniref:AraC family transcriptional regulator n=1 Tax=Periweissella cryptocerci TaxID=2506420 RepID=A0A4P6YVZ8_9LACO|nr:AraC family transcriptional regulator [Periweissella cryptocerci]QBO36907.1 AraC family transcriptional regulator [Periweissella cryptocerci]